MKAPPCIVTQAGVPCALVCLTGRTRGMALLPGAPIAVFANRRRARRAVARTQRVAKLLRGSIISDWPKLKALFAPDAAYKIEPLEQS